MVKKKFLRYSRQRVGIMKFLRYSRNRVGIIKFFRYSRKKVLGHKEVL